eukprot:m.308990 g.308990  ORF g.308990 m.308990 type:complete len:312 (+) comp45233_c0_seq1:73-1008(+)
MTMGMTMRLCAFAFVLSLISLAATVNERPIIGILTEGTTSQHGTLYLAASYVKYIESSGARVVPILVNWTSEELDSVLSSVNGVLFPGGGSNLANSSYFDAAKQVYQHAIKASKSGQLWPVWGTCLGFETLNVIAAGTTKVLGSFDSENYSIPLQFVKGYETSRLFKNCPPEVIQILSEEPVTMNNHQEGVDPEVFSVTSALTSFFQVLSVNKDRKGKSFVSTFEAYHYPIYGTQWHPEKNPFEWTTSEGINHSPEAVLVSQYMSDFFVSQARMNDNHFASPEDEMKYLIYRYTPTYVGNESHSFEQSYYW